MVSSCYRDRNSVALLVWPHEVESLFHSWYRGRVETLEAKYNLSLDCHTKWSHGFILLQR